MALEDELLAIEEELWTGGPDAYRRWVDEACLVAFAPSGGLMSRDEIAGTVADGPRWRELAIEVEGLHRPVDGVAFLTYRAAAVRGEDERYRARVGSGYVRRGDEWKLTFHQQTPLAE